MFRRTLYFNNVTLLTADGPIGDSLRIRGDRIVGIGGPPHKNDRLIDGHGGVFIPGLINAHDHLELNTFKRLKYRDCYTHSLDWIEDVEQRFDSDPDLVEPRRQPLADRLWVSALKNLLSGVTTVCHHNPLHRPLRRHYPIRVVKNYGFCHSLFRGEEPIGSYKKTNRADPWLIHLAEGIDDRAEAEFDRLDAMGLVGQNTVLVHGVGLTPVQQQALIERGAGLIWCPGSNRFLFGRTACIQPFARAGKLALGSDSRLSGEFDLLAELRVAADAGQLSPQALFQTVTTHAAQLLRLREGGQGRITAGGIADLVMLPASVSADRFEEIFTLRRSQLRLVLVGGKPLVGAPQMQPVFEAAKTGYAPIQIDQQPKLMSQKLVSRLKKLSVQETGLTY